MRTLPEKQKRIQFTITVETYLAELLESAARKAGMKPSRLVAALIQRHLCNDDEVFTLLAKYHAGKMNEALFMRDQARAQKEILNTGR